MQGRKIEGLVSDVMFTETLAQSTAGETLVLNIETQVSQELKEGAIGALVIHFESDPDGQIEITDWLISNQNNLSEMSGRVVQRIKELRDQHPEDWSNLASADLIT